MMRQPPGKNKGQTGIENLILLAFVLVVVILGAIALWRLGIFEPYTSRKGYVGFSQIIPIDWVIGGNRIAITFKNQADSIVTVFPDRINISVEDIDCPPLAGAAFNVNPTEGFVVDMQCPGLAERFEIGDYYSADATVNYTHLASGQNRLSVGKIYGHIEDLPEDWVPPTSSTTTTLEPVPQCFYKNCSKPGEMDPLDCGEIWFSGGYENCRYCPQDPAPDGQFYCQPNGKCGKLCSSDNHCRDINDPYNICETCIDNRCVENNTEDECGACQFPSHGLTDPKCMLLPQCSYCAHYYVVDDPFIPAGHHEWTCENKGDCGETCLNMGFDRYLECQIPQPILEQHCPHCEPVNLTHGKCDQGDCGKPCGPANPLQECELGCKWCNYTPGEPSSFKCELGDCGQPCGPSNPIKECETGCQTCAQVAPGTWKCVYTDITASLYVHNITDGKVVEVNGTIYQNATAQCSTGVSDLVISNSINITNRTSLGPTPWARCAQLSDDVYSWWLTNGRPNPLDPATELQLKNTFNLTWNATKDCGGVNDCFGNWKTNESWYGQYCYFAWAKKMGSTKWSNIASDWIQVGYINVYLISPKPIPPP